MKRKAQKAPDFSTKRPARGEKAPQEGDKAAPVAPRTVVKPQATSSKSGRRGQ